MKTIRQLRDERRWTQKALADKVGVGRQAVWYWETGQREPGIGHARSIAQAFGVCMEDIDFERPARERAGDAGNDER